MKNVRTFSKRKTEAMRIGDANSDIALNGFNKECRVTGLTNGAFSLISLIRSTLKITGNAKVIISTWSAGFYDVEQINTLIASNKIDDFKIILDRSFKTRQEGYSAHITDLFKPENIRTTNTHSKFVLIWNDEGWNVCIRSSMNLNENRRCENYDIDNDIDVFNLFKSFSDELFEKQPQGIIEDRKIVDPVFADLFNQPLESDELFADVSRSISF
jgi:hypothetical protein